MKTSVKYIASLAIAIGATIGFAPVAIAASDSSSGSHAVPQTAAPVHPRTASADQAVPQKAAPATQIASPGRLPSEQPPFGVGVDPLVLTDTGADPFVLMPQGDGSAF